MSERDRRVECHARALFELLYEYESRDRIFALTEITQRVQRKLASRESSRLRLDLIQDAAIDDRDTDPDTAKVGDRVTRRIDVDSLREHRKRSRDDNEKG